MAARPNTRGWAGFAQRGVALLLADSTNSDKAGWTESEAVIEGALDRVFRRAQGPHHGGDIRVLDLPRAAGG